MMVTNVPSGYEQELARMSKAWSLLNCNADECGFYGWHIVILFHRCSLNSGGTKKG
jgi:hypothetical protein